jgi:diaminohydroxyphosphoribosylaminopyrimidine deaminase/5-amino-6-(5-phosphoribosylamino)uracil reductase
MTLDETHMARAVRLGHRALGTTAENPPVGCVIAQGERIVGVGWTAPGGRPHAETQALAMAGGQARGASAYVTLEPCAHHGRTPPCAEALIEAGIARVVSALEDPDPRTDGGGHRLLRAAGIEVEVGLGASGARRDLAGFFSRILRKRPQVTLKLALSADGKIAEGPGTRTAISGERANARVHLMRAQSDAIMVGIGTVLADDPSLTCRLPGLEARSPLRVVLSSHRGLPPDSRLAQTATRVMGNATEAFKTLADEGINTVFAEGGARVARSLVEADLVDRLILIRAPKNLGGQGLDAFAGLPLGEVLARFETVEQEKLGPDRLTVYHRRGAS